MAQEFQAAFEKASLKIVHNVDQFTANADDEYDIELRDPELVAQDLATQTSFLRKLKFRYLEQNAKSKYITSIVSDIDDAAIVTAEDNNALAVVCEEKKEKLRIAKAALAEVRTNIRTMAPVVDKDYLKLKEEAARAAALSQKIIDGRLALTRLRHAHPKPRMTIPTAEQRLTDQVTEMQALTDDIEQASKKVGSVKGGIKSGTQEVEKLRAERAEADKAVKALRVDDDDGRLVPLYDQYTAVLSFHRSVFEAQGPEHVSENEVQLSYVVRRRPISINLIFHPNTKWLAAASVVGLDELGVDPSELVDSHVQINDPKGLVAAVLALARQS
ncbi:hypothetical protein FB45DRAFT_397641 [Roridomyces roridus]|uniref:Kinetochore protein Sos7 coiled-coil domain-containing protein n=1 Tax=Roridomyces roridus TaxID=1738132 RepID=A0AAD7FR25_9AGAR|nr:hypothetical protein FB45DRAFT_397641 [Roridomyces roridus]